VEASIVFAAGADDNPLGVWAADVVRQNVADRDSARRAFEALRAAVAMVAPDRRLQVTLRFDHGYLTIHDGMIGIPDVTLCGDYQVLMGIGEVPLSRRGSLPLPPWSRARRADWTRTLLEVASGELKIYGLWAHPRLVTRLLRVLSHNAG
jgi:hypothetical protein